MKVELIMNYRKNDHLHFALNQQTKQDNFSDIRLIHRSLSNVNLDDVSLETSIHNCSFQFPFYINAITGGTRKAFDINRDLCKIASTMGIMLCFGSISPIIKDASLLDEYKQLINENDNLIFSLNIGADKSYDMVEDAINQLKPRFLQVHLNTLQELIMPEGDRNFSNIKANIAEFVKKSAVPIIVKEVGFGMSYQTIATLESIGVKAIDISGTGGTNFAMIENMRRETSLDYLNDWGISTLLSMLESQPYVDKIDILASGGVNNPLDIIKCLVLGAKSVGMAGLILKYLDQNGVSKTINYVEEIKNELKLIMTLLDADNINKLRSVDYVLTGETYNFFKQRGAKCKIRNNL